MCSGCLISVQNPDWVHRVEQELQYLHNVWALIKYLFDLKVVRSHCGWTWRERLNITHQGLAHSIRLEYFGIKFKGENQNRFTEQPNSC